MNNKLLDGVICNIIISIHLSVFYEGVGSSTNT